MQQNMSEEGNKINRKMWCYLPTALTTYKIRNMLFCFSLWPEYSLYWNITKFSIETRKSQVKWGYSYEIEGQRQRKHDLTTPDVLRMWDRKWWKHCADVSSMEMFVMEKSKLAGINWFNKRPFLATFCVLYCIWKVQTYRSRFFQIKKQGF